MDFMSAVTAPLRFAGGLIGSAFNFAGGVVGGALDLAGSVAMAPFAMARSLFSPSSEPAPPLVASSSGFNDASFPVGGPPSSAPPISPSPDSVSVAAWGSPFSPPDVVALHVPDKGEMEAIRAGVHERLAAGVPYRQSFYSPGGGAGPGGPPPSMVASGEQPAFAAGPPPPMSYPVGTRIDARTGEPIRPLANAPVPPPSSPSRAFNPASQKPVEEGPGPVAATSGPPPASPRQRAPGGMG